MFDRQRGEECLLVAAAMSERFRMEPILIEYLVQDGKLGHLRHAQPKIVVFRDAALVVTTHRVQYLAPKHDRALA